MKTLLRAVLLSVAVSAGQVGGQGLLFDFDSATVHTPLPINQTVGGLTATFAGNFGIQEANTMGFTPIGFAGNCIYPNSIFASDLTITFSAAMTDFSILYAPQELGCDTSARMRVTAWLNGAMVGTAVTNASAPGTWPTETLAIHVDGGFNSAVVHYDQAPACTDRGPIFMADNMVVTPAPTPVVLENPVKTAPGVFGFTFTNQPGLSFRVFGTTNTALSFGSWDFLGSASESAAGQFQFTDTAATNAQKFYRVVSP